jgi:hypothetical protein
MRLTPKLKKKKCKVLFVELCLEYKLDFSLKPPFPVFYFEIIFGAATLNIIAHGRMTLSRMTLSVIALGRMTLSIIALIKMTVIAQSK